jgi:tripartite-type tricarboxylate transporter receptor subunit TctC
MLCSAHQELISHSRQYLRWQTFRSPSVSSANHMRTHEKLKRGLKLAFAVISVTALACQVGWSQTQQTKTQQTIRIIIPFPPGGSTDLVGRLLADQFSRTQSISVIVENRPGAGSVVGTEAVARAAPDGNTLLMPANSFVINRIVRKLDYDPLSFEPICLLVRTAQVLAVNSSAPYRTLADYLADASAHPGALTNASVGPATIQHVALEMLKHEANVDITFVPFSGNVPAVNALLGGHVTSVIVNFQDVSEYVKVGKLRALATTLRSRIEEMPDVPTIAESGFKDFETETWIGLVAPPKTPQAIVAQLASVTASALQAPEVKTKLRAAGLSPIGLCGASFAHYLHDQSNDYTRVLRASNIKIE